MNIHKLLVIGRKRKMQTDDYIAPCVIDREEEEAENAQFNDIEEDDENRSLAEGMEEMLGDALQLVELRTGSLLALQSVPRNKAVQLGRRISTFTVEDVDDGSSIRSYNSKLDSRSNKEPVFLKVNKGDPTILTQQSWESIMELSNASTERQSQPRPVTKEVDLAVLKPRKWDKLRTTIEKEEKEKNSSRSRFAFGSGLKKTLGIFRRRRKSDFVEPNDTEVASKDSARTGDSGNTHEANESGVFPSSFDHEEVGEECSLASHCPEIGDDGEECSLASHGPEIGEETTPLESQSHIDKRKSRRARAHRHVSKSHSSTSPEEAESLEVVYTDNHILPPFPTTMV
jgi:hypothetical protein